MLISCPKCHSIYEIPDNLIPKTGQNFRCQACANVWHAMRQDAIGYEEEYDEEPYIEAIPVSEPPRRYPADKSGFNIPADSKSGKKTRSSQEIILNEGNQDYIPPSSKTKKKKEIPLTSDRGTSFTISAAPLEDEEYQPKRFFDTDDNDEPELTANVKERLSIEKPFKGYKKTYALLFLIVISALLCFLRREITAFFPQAEAYYNKINLTGINNPEYLVFKNITLNELTVENKQIVQVNATIYNDSFLTTQVPDVTLSGTKETFIPENKLLKGHEQTKVEILLPKEGNNLSSNLILGFVKP